MHTKAEKHRKKAAIEVFVYNPDLGPLSKGQRQMQENPRLKERFEQYLSVGVYFDKGLKYYVYNERNYDSTTIKKYSSLAELVENLPEAQKGLFQNHPKLFLIGHGSGGMYGLLGDHYDKDNVLDDSEKILGERFNQVIDSFKQATPGLKDRVVTLEGCNVANRIEGQKNKDFNNQSFLENLSKNHRDLTLCGSAPWKSDDNVTGVRAQLNLPITSMTGSVWKSGGNWVVFYNGNELQVVARKSVFASTQSAKEVKVNTIEYANEALNQTKLSPTKIKEKLQNISLSPEVLTIDDLKKSPDFPKEIAENDVMSSFIKKEKHLLDREKNNYIELVTDIISTAEKGKKITTRDSLILALVLKNLSVFDGHEKLMEKLLSQSALLQAVMVTCGQVLIAGSDNDQLIDLLRNRGIDINTKDDDGRTALHYAAHYFYFYHVGDREREPLQLIRKLIDSGANLEATDDEGNTPIMLANRFGHIQVVQVLKKYRAKIEEQPADSFTNTEIKETVALELLDTGASGKITKEQESLEKLSGTARLHRKLGVNKSTAIKLKEENERIKEIVNNLRPSIQLKGEPGKNIFDRMRELKVPNVSVTVFSDDHSWTREYSLPVSGESQKKEEPSIFQAASISKTINAVLAMKILVDTGRMSLDDDVNLHLKDWKIPGDSFKEKVTLRRLLSHTAGLSVSGFPGYPSTLKEIPTTMDVLKGNEALKNLSMAKVEKLWEIMPDNAIRTAPVEITAEPGSQMAYSGGGTTVIQKLIEEATGESYAALAKKHIFDPLKMNSSSFEFKFPATAAENVMKAHSEDGNPIAGDWHIYPELAAAGLWTTSDDLTKFAIAMQEAFRGESDTLLSQESAKQMLTLQPNSKCGLGFFIFDYDNEMAFGHSGGNEGFMCDSINLPHINAGVVIMTNASKGGNLTSELMTSIFETYKWPGKQHREVEAIEIDPLILNRCIGEYVITSREGTSKATVTLEHGKLVIAVPFPHLTSETTQKCELIPESQTVFCDLKNNSEVTFNANYNEVSFFGVKGIRSQPELALPTAKVAKDLGATPAIPEERHLDKAEAKSAQHSPRATQQVEIHSEENPSSGIQKKSPKK